MSTDIKVVICGPVDEVGINDRFFNPSGVESVLEAKICGK
jgi:hypothetical protein